MMMMPWNHCNADSSIRPVMVAHVSLLLAAIAKQGRTEKYKANALNYSVFRDKRYRVSSDLGNLEMSGNFDARRKSHGKVKEFCCVKFIFSQFEHPNFENFLGEHAPDPLYSLGHT